MFRLVRLTAALLLSFACEPVSTVDGGVGGGSTAGGSTAGGSTAGGSTAGGSTAGGSTAGGSMAGGSMAGGSMAGGSMAGGSMAGGSTAGGSTAGGSTAGGSTAGGSTAGGSTAGGSTAGGSTAGGAASDGGYREPSFDAGVAGLFDGGTAPVQFPSTPQRCPTGFRTSLAAGRHTGFPSGGQSRSFELRLPPTSFTGPRPLVFAFHGTNLSGAVALTEYGLSNWTAAGAIVLAPDTNGNGFPWPVWDSTQFPTRLPAPNADLAFFDDLLFCVTGHHSVDARRIYVLGHSAGGAASNFILGRRSSVLAGGIPASGGIEFTQPATPSTDPLTVIVTWGGSNDCYTGSTGGVSVSSCFEEQSALATSFWAARPNTVQVNCRGSAVGHVWLRPIETWMMNLLLSRPKGVSAAGFTLPMLPSGANATCSQTPFTYQPPAMVTCPSSTRSGCQAYCQMLGDCLAENGSLGPATVPQLMALGFSNSANICGGCVSQCETDGMGAADGQVLSCLATAAPATQCAPGFAGARSFQTMAMCCGQQAASSQVCGRFCTTFRTNQVLASYFPWCP